MQYLFQKIKNILYTTTTIDEIHRPYTVAGRAAGSVHEQSLRCCASSSK
ncbi:MAG: hypothetical protein LBJ00_00500 [Planctomycetaceae bacterium]|nr:hypothetical protein [Planctomycetaceae bacterium]